MGGHTTINSGAVSSNDCSTCIPGTKRKESNGDFEECEGCEAGRYSPDGASSQCFDCPEGKIIPTDANTFSEHDNINDCSSCPEGYHYKSREACESCPGGRYQDEQEQSNCKACPENTFLQQKGSSNVTDCLACQSGQFA